MKKLALLVGAIVFAGASFAQPPSIFDGGIVNGAAFQKGQPVAPGSLIAIFGTQLASKTASADTIPLSTSLGGVTVQFVSGTNTISAPLTFITPDNPSAQTSAQINAQVPWELVPNDGSHAPITMVVTRDGVSSAPSSVTISAISPGVFASNGRAIAISLDGTLAWPAGTIPGLTTHSVKPGDVLTIYATGLGAVDSPISNGENSMDKLRNTLVTPVVMVGGISAQVLFSGLTPQFVGVNQINIIVPNAPAGDNVPLQIQAGGFTTPGSTTIAVSNQ